MSTDPATGISLDTVAGFSVGWVKAVRIEAATGISVGKVAGCGMD